MSVLVPIALVGFFPLTFVLFARLPGHRAVIAAVVIGVLFLPEVSERSLDSGSQPVNLEVMKLTKLHVLACAVLLASLWRDGRRWQVFRPAWFDVPLLVWSACPLAASLANGLGWQDGLASVRDRFWTWTVPYFIGRLYLTDLAACRDFAVAVVLGGLAYLPLCLFEARMSPQLHHLMYGFTPQEFQQTVRFGGYRPVVFMQHGLAVSMWLVTATLFGYWLWRTRSLTHLSLGRGVPPVPLGWMVAVLLATSLLCRSSGALVLGVAGFVGLSTARLFRVPVVLAGLALVPPVYAGVRISDAWDGRDLVAWIGTHFSAERAQSLMFRLDNEDKLIQRALERPVIGWGGWGRARVISEETGKDETIIDGLWILAFGETGVVGLVALLGAVLLPAARTLRMVPGPLWAHPAIAPAGVAATVLVLYMIDCLVNGMVNPCYLVAAGGLASLTDLRAGRASRP